MRYSLSSMYAVFLYNVWCIGTLQSLSVNYSYRTIRFKTRPRKHFAKNIMQSNPQALLLSSSNCHGFSILEFAKKDICEVLKKNLVHEIMFIPYARLDYNNYTTSMKTIIDKWGFRLKGIHMFDDPIIAVKTAKAIFVGGGNTFLLLKTLYKNNLVELIRQRVNYENLIYIGSSAGTNVATANIHTTNDMPIVYPPSFDAISIVPFNINPHYIEWPLSEKHKGETRDQRILEYLLMPHANTVVGLREGCILKLNGNYLSIQGVAGVVIFSKGQDKYELPVGSDISFLLKKVMKI